MVVLYTIISKAGIDRQVRQTNTHTGTTPGTLNGVGAAFRGGSVSTARHREA